MASGFDIAACTAHYRAAFERARARRRAAREALRATAADAAFQLQAQHGAEEVWLFGSVAWGEPHEGSDVDLLVVGVPEADWLRIGRTAEQGTQERVDVIRAEDAPEALVERVRREGIRLL